MTLRVLPALTLAVTEDELRRRKRILMLFPGLIAFIVYRVLHVFGWHSDIAVLLAVCGLYSSGVAVVSYVHGRQEKVAAVLREDGIARVAWFGFRYGFVYAIQLALMVLALLTLVSYSYLHHPDGPAMMALIIASTSVARDAFELGHVRSLQQQGRPVGAPSPGLFWNFVKGHAALWLWPAMLGAAVAAAGYLGVALIVPWIQTDLGQLLVVGIIAGVTAVCSYVMGLQPSLPLWQSLSRCHWRELLKFFLWPGVAFGGTYDLILLGVTSFVIVIPEPSLLWRVTVVAGTTVLMVLYCSYLGRCRWQEEKLHATISPAILRCPFIVGILTSKKA